MGLKDEIHSTFLRGGIHLTDDGKSLTALKPIERFVPKEVVIPLLQHMGPPAKPVVKRKSKVTRGDLIGEAQGGGVPVHASVSGTVTQVALRPHPTLAESMAVVLETDNNLNPAEEALGTEDPNWMDLPAEEMITRIASAGIVGLGGAAFPTYRKLRLPPGVVVDTLILNGAECEPYLTCDERLMMEVASEIVQGGFLLAKIVGAKTILIGVEDNKPLAFNTLKEAVARVKLPIPIRVAACKARYPQGSEKQLIEALTGRVVPPGKLPFHAGIVVQNVATAFSCYQAIRYGRPLLDRVVTVSGGGILNPKNLRVPIGTPIDAIVQFCGGIHPDTIKVIAGGPMMGRALGRLDVPVTKGMSGILFFRSDEIREDYYGPCISCGRCLEACPLGLEPNQISIYTEAGRALETEEFGTKECFECGCCAVVCPSARPLVQFIQMTKQAFQTGSQIGLAVRPGGTHVC